MLDRESTFGDDTIVAMLSKKFIPVAIDVFYHERRKDAEGDFYRKVVYQRKGLQKGRTTQGFYIFTPQGTLIAGWNNRDPKKVQRRLKEALQKQHVLRAEPIQLQEDKRYARTPPKGGLVVDVYSKVLRAKLEPTKNQWRRIMRSSLGRDHLWITKAEVAALRDGKWPISLTNRITRYHFIDNTRGEPPMWRGRDITASDWNLTKSQGAHRLTGTAKAATPDGKRGYDFAVAGRVTSDDDKITRLDLVARGQYWGGGKFSSNDLPTGRFDFAIAFRIAGDDAAAQVPPQGSRDLHGYLDPR